MTKAEETQGLTEQPRVVIARGEGIRAEVGELLDVVVKAEHDATTAYETERERVVEEQLERMPLDALKNASDGRLRLGAIQAAGLTTVTAIRRAGQRRLQSIQGVGPKTSTQVLAAATQVEDALRKVTRVRFDVDARPPTQTTLLVALRAYDMANRNVGPLRTRLEALAQAIDADLETSRLEARRIRRFFSGRQRKQEARAAFERLASLLAHPDTDALGVEVGQARQRLADPADGPEKIWDDYTARSVLYNGLLIEIGGQGPDEAAAHGFLPEEIVERIKGVELDTMLLGASLRGYQAFGAKFALVQGRTILGDEMGLGKTIEALAVMCHLRAQGATHFLVVSPASVLANWEHEIGRHSRLERVWRLHGPERDRRLRHWTRHGGIALTTFGTLPALGRPDVQIAAAVIDEAHYVKNPRARRTKAVRSWIDNADHVLLMSGTPMENRVDEFRALVDHIRPEIAETIRTTDGIAGADAFRTRVAPVYLRRNQTDVLDELPPKIESAEWLTLDGAAGDVYRRAVADGNFMAMRRAAFLTARPADSPKFTRLAEIVEEAVDNNRKVVVYSFFRDVVARVHEGLGRLAVGPLTGSVPARHRQVLIDQFSARRDPAVLVSQIEAGGVGLNIQAASVVILTEPQWKPSIEEQAIARCHRMGQVRPVEVHRLLTENSVDERMLVVLARKSALFADYVRASALKDATPEAIDVTDHDRLSQVATQAEQERRIIELERRRLGVAA